MGVRRLRRRGWLMKRNPVRAGLGGAVVALGSEVSAAGVGGVVVNEVTVVVAGETAVDSCRKEQQWQKYVLNILRVRLATRRIKKRPSGRLASANCSRRLNMKISLLYVE